jgi:hypothetical protein
MQPVIAALLMVMVAFKAVSILEHLINLYDLTNGTLTWQPGIRSVQSTTNSTMTFLSVSGSVPTLMLGNLRSMEKMLKES